MFTNGILDVFMKNGIRFDAVVGVSAGVLFGCNYKSNQPSRALRYNLRYKDNIEYMSWKSLIKTGNYVNERFSYHLLPYMLDQFRLNAYKILDLRKKLLRLFYPCLIYPQYFILFHTKPTYIKF